MPVGGVGAPHDRGTNPRRKAEQDRGLAQICGRNTAQRDLAGLHRVVAPVVVEGNERAVLVVDFQGKCWVDLRALFLWRT